MRRLLCVHGWPIKPIHLVADPTEMKCALGALAVFVITGCTSTTAAVQPRPTTAAIAAKQPARTSQSNLPAEAPQLDHHQWITVKYRNSSVDLSAPGFVRLDLSKGGDIGQAWWDSQNDYMVIELTGIFYHYCAFTAPDAEQFEATASADDHYRSTIKGTHDCRYEGVVPDYGTLATTRVSASPGSYGSGFDADAERERLIEDAEFDLGRSIDEDKDYETLDEIDRAVEGRADTHSESEDD